MKSKRITRSSAKYHSAHQILSTKQTNNSTTVNQETQTDNSIHQIEGELVEVRKINKSLEDQVKTLTNTIKILTSDIRDIKFIMLFTILSFFFLLFWAIFYLKG
jgi:septal ring factor EnvC (AmiA/AmiB activator)